MKTTFVDLKNTESTAMASHMRSSRGFGAKRLSPGIPKTTAVDFGR